MKKKVVKDKRLTDYQDLRDYVVYNKVKNVPINNKKTKVFK